MKREIVITEKLNEDSISYGLKIRENGKTTCFSGLTERKDRIEQLKRNLENSDISAVHINDIIRDFVTEDACDRLLLNSLL